MSVSKNHICFIFILIILKVNCYEKTLRKIVRSQSKMVQRPFSDTIEGNLDRNSRWKNTSSETSDALMFSGHSQMKKKLHKLQRSKISSILTQVDKNSYGKGSRRFNNKKNIAIKNGSISPNELRLIRDARRNVSLILHKGVKDVDIFVEDDNQNHICNNNCSDVISIDNYYEIPPQEKSNSVLSMNKLKQDPAKHVILIPSNSIPTDKNSSSLLKGVFISNSEMTIKPSNLQGTGMDISAGSDDDRIDFLLQGKPVDANPAAYSYNTSLNIYSCSPILESQADIITKEKFAILNIEPNWTSQKLYYWSNIFDSRYESLMTNPDWPPLRVILVPRTHVDSIWKKTFELGHNNTVHKIISNIVKKLQYYDKLTFSWNEVSHLAQWWKTATTKSRSALRRLIKQGRLEIAAGGWVETDEATSHIFGLVHQLIEGQQWLKNNLNHEPEVAWLTNSVSHGPTMTYLLSASGINNLVLTNIHYSWEEYFAEYQYSDFIWLQNWESDRSGESKLNTAFKKIGNDRYPKHSVLTHVLQFNSADFRACGPNKSVCADFYLSAKGSHNFDVFSGKLKEKAEILLEQYSKTGTVTSHNTVIAPLGGSYHFEKQSEFDYQYNYYKKIADYVNTNRDVYKATIEFGTAKDYFDNIYNTHKSFPTLVGDFVNFADLISGTPAYWTGYYTTRPWLKILLRRLQSSLRTTEIIFSFAKNLNVFQGFDTEDLLRLLVNIREFVARLQDRHVVGGTVTANTMKYIYKQILTALKNCWHIQEVCTSLLSMKPNKPIKSPFLQKYLYRDGELISLFRTVSPGEQIYVFNSLSHERTEIIELMVRNPNVRIIDHNQEEVTIQINPVWKYSDNSIKISRLFYKIVFAITVPPLTLELFRIKETSDSSLNVANIYCSTCIIEDSPDQGTASPFSVQPIQPGDIQLESYKLRLTFDERTGFLKNVVEKKTGRKKIVLIDYGAFKSSNVNAGIFLFNTNISKPLRDIIMPYRIGLKQKIVFIVSGQVTTELTSIFGHLLQSAVKIFNLLNSPLSNAIDIESRVDYETSPKNRELELFISIQTSINNGNPPELFSDNNGFQYTARILNISRRIESNMYPMTTMSYIQDNKNRLTVITDHAQGVTALQEGQIILMLDRRVLYNDKRGTDEGLSDSSITHHRNLILLENFLDNTQVTNKYLQLPSLPAVHLANSLDYQLEIFVMEKSKSNLCHYAFLPLVKSSFPCDISLITYRMNVEKGFVNQYSNTALMILHRQSVFCGIDYDVHLRCNADVNFSLQKIMHNVRATYKTNLSGTGKGVPITVLNQSNFPPMELATLRVYFS